MFSKISLTAAALCAAALVSQPAGAGEGRYGFRCTILDKTMTSYPPGSALHRW